MFLIFGQRAADLSELRFFFQVSDCLQIVFTRGPMIFRVELFHSASDDDIYQGKKKHPGRRCDVLHIENQIGADGIGEITRIAYPGRYLGFLLAHA